MRFLGLQNRQDCYCAFCKSPRKVYTKKSIGVVDILASALGATVVMYGVWQELDPRAILFFILFLALSETFVKLRWRLNMACRQCGFDPILYLKNSDAAVEKVKMRLGERAADPNSLLASPLRIPRISRVRADENAKALAFREDQVSKNKGRYISKQV